MQGKHWLVVVSVLILGAFSCKELNKEGYCPSHPDDIDCLREPDTCGTISCDPATPVCDETTTTCVECLQDSDCRSAQQPICNDQHMCGQCSEHDQCADSQLCLIDGQCADPKDVTYVGGPGALNNMMCTKDMPCQNLDQALKPTALRKYIKVTGEIVDPVPMIDNKNAIIYGGPGALFSRSVLDEVLIIKGTSQVTLIDLVIKGNMGAAGKDCVEISEDAQVTMRKVRVRDHGQVGISLSQNGKLVLMDSQVHDNGFEGIKAMSGTNVEIIRSLVYKNTKVSGMAGVYGTGATKITIDSSTIAANTAPLAGGVSISGPFSIKNSIIAANGNVTITTMGAGGLNLSPPNAASAQFEFNTVSDNQSSSSTGMSCAIQFGVSNSIFTNNTVNGCEVSFSVLGLTGTDTGSIKYGDPVFLTKTLLDPKFYRIGSGSVARDSADPAATLGSDIDGQLRNDARKDMGADEYRP